MSDDSPFNRSGLTRRSLPPTPSPRPEPAPAPPTQPPPAPKPDQQEDPLTVHTTPELHGWLTSIEQYLADVCNIYTEGKLNTDHKIRVHNLCRKVAHCLSLLVVEYQALKQKAIQYYTSSKSLQSKSTSLSTSTT